MCDFDFCSDFSALREEQAPPLRCCLNTNGVVCNNFVLRVSNSLEFVCLSNTNFTDYLVCVFVFIIPLHCGTSGTPSPTVLFTNCRGRCFCDALKTVGFVAINLRCKLLDHIVPKNRERINAFPTEITGLRCILLLFTSPT